MGFICQTWGLKQRAHADSTLFFAMKWDLCGKLNTKTSDLPATMLSHGTFQW